MVQQKVCGNIARKRTLEHRGAVPQDVDLLREYQAMHEENVLCCWLSEDWWR